MTPKQVEKLAKRAWRAIERATESAQTAQGRSRLEEIEIYTGYTEPGYAEHAVVALGNWNDITRYDEATRAFEDVDRSPSAISAALEKLGCELEWSDEWARCDGCGHLVRTQPDSYSWKRSYVETDGDILCFKCIDPVDHLERLEGQSRRCNTILTIDPAQHGYVKIECSFEHGLHPGQAADPATIAKTLQRVGVRRFLFQLDETRQFDLDFSVYVHESALGHERVGDDSLNQADERSGLTMGDIVRLLLEKENAQPPGPTPAERLQAQLAGAAHAMKTRVP